MLLEGSYSEVALAVVMSLIGVYLLAVALGGVWRIALHPLPRLVCLAAAILTIWPGVFTDAVGIGLALLVYVYQKKAVAAGKARDLVAKLKEPLPAAGE